MKVYTISNVYPDGEKELIHIYSDLRKAEEKVSYLLKDMYGDEEDLVVDEWEVEGK